MDSRYNYDEKNETWPIFSLALVSMVVIPVTASSLSSIFSSPHKSKASSSSSILSDALTKHSSPNVRSYRAKAKASALLTKKMLALFMGWIAIFALVYQIQSVDYKPSSAAFDPYDILGIDYGTPEKEIKTHFRKLSVKFHPDKLSANTEEEKLQNEEYFVLISKAYKALTDEVVRENYEKYGHPDGPQTVTHGIALPKWLIEGSTSPLLLGFYVLFISLILPLIVRRWWNKTKSLTKKGIDNETAEQFVDIMLNANPARGVTVDRIMQILSNTVELTQKHTSKQILEIFDKHLERKPLTNAELRIIGQVPLLINGFIDICSTFRNFDYTNMAIETQKLFIQALKQSPYNEILQLPNVSPEAVKETRICRLSKLLTLKKEEIKKALGIEDDKKLQETLDVAKRIPILKVIEAKFKVPGESVVTPVSNGYFSIKVLVKSPGHHGPLPNIPKERLQEEESMEHLRDPYKMMNEQPTLPKTFAPYFPLEKTSNYIGLVVLQKDVKLTQVPDYFTKLDVSNLEFSQEQYLKGEGLSIGTFKIPLQGPTPANADDYAFRIIIKSMDYFIPDLDETVIMKVENLPKVEEVDYEIPENDEDEYSGGEYESGEESDDEDNVGEDFTDIDTDTDEEN